MRLLKLFSFSLVISTSLLARADERAGDAAIRIEPFKQIGDQPNRAWIADALQAALAADIQRLNPSRAYRLVGSYQTVDSQLRIDGELLDDNGKFIGPINARGTVDQLFALEDALSEQTQMLIRQRPVMRIPTTRPGKLPGPDAADFRTAFTGPVSIHSPFKTKERWLGNPNAHASEREYFYDLPLDFGFGYYGDYPGGWSGAGFFGFGNYHSVGHAFNTASSRGEY